LGTSGITVKKSGIFVMEFCIVSDLPAQFTMFINGNPEITTTAGTNKGAGQLLLRQTVSLYANDTITFVNHSSAVGSVVSTLNSGGILTGVNAIGIIRRISPRTADLDPCTRIFKEITSCHCDKDEEKFDDYDYDKLYASFRKYLKFDCQLQPAGSQAWIDTYSNDEQTVKLENPAVYKYNGLIKNGVHITGDPKIMVCEDGIYECMVNSVVDVPSQFTIFVNGVADTNTTIGTSAGANENTLRTLLKLKRGDYVTFVNHTSFVGDVQLSHNPGGDLWANNLQCIVWKIAPWHDYPMWTCLKHKPHDMSESDSVFLTEIN